MRQVYRRQGAGVKIILEGGQGEIEEKKSRFIATVKCVNSQEEAAAFITAIKKQYWDARHNCSAYVIGERGELAHSSDDGEPAGTAGRPMLAVLQGENLTNVCVVVTRYFGGVLLGTGGLVRAYSAAVQAGLGACRIAECIDGFRLRVGTDYNGIGKLQYLLAQRQLPVTDTLYGESVEIETLVPEAEAAALMEDITQKTLGKAEFLVCDPVRYAREESGVTVLGARAAARAESTRVQ